MIDRGVAIRLLAALLALGAGIAAVVVVASLVHDVIG